MDTTTTTQINYGGLDMTTLADLPAFLCCCSILNESLGPDQHLDDCELQFFTGEFRLPSDDSVLPQSTSELDSHNESSCAASKKRRHRESMARLRHSLRESITTLKNQERQLTRTLHQSVDQCNSQPTSKPSSDARQKPVMSSAFGQAPCLPRSLFSLDVLTQSFNVVRCLERGP